jgi:hypothetical protein
VQVETEALVHLADTFDADRRKRVA